MSKRNSRIKCMVEAALGKNLRAEDSEELIHLKDLNAAQTCPQEEPHQLMSESVSSEQQINIMYDDNIILAADSGELIHLKDLNAAQTCLQEEPHQLLMSESVLSEQQMNMYDDNIILAADSGELIHLKDLNAAQTSPQEEPHQLLTSESVLSEQQMNNIMYDDNNILAADSGELIHLKVLNAAQTCPQEELHQLMSESVSSEQQMYNIVYDDEVSAAGNVPELRIFRQFSKTMTKSANVGFIISESEEEPYSDRDSIADPAYSPGTSISHYSDSQDKTIEVPSNLLNKPVDCKPALTRKRQRKPESWKRNKLRRLRLEGKEYLSEKGNIVRAKAVQPVNCKCYYKCNEKFSMEQRQTIFQDYLSLEDERSKWSYIANCIKKQKPKRRYQSQIPENGNQPNRPKKMYTLIYNLTCSDTTHQVCKQFFLKTLDVSGKKVKTSLSKKSETGVVTPDQRGKKPAPNKIPEDRKGHVRAHIKSMPVIESHYCRSQTKRKYLPTYLSENRLYTDYVEYCKEKEIDPVKPSFYKHVFRTEFNLGFHRPKKDQCDFCAQYKNKNDEDKKNNEEEYQLHLKRKVEARQHKEQDKTRAKTDASFRAYTMDMEKILLSPQVLIGQLYYKRKLKTYNFTIYELAKALAVNYMWHEGNGTKGASEVATCLWNLMLKLDSQVTEVTFYSDTAAGQNRNSILAAMFLRALTVLPNLQIINQKYMESGHSDMECDSVHSTIENRGKKIDIFTPEGWFTVARTAKTTSPPYEVCEMDHSQFIDFKTCSEKLIKNKNKAENGESMNWLKVKWLQYRKEEPLHIFYKNQLSDDEFKRLPIRTARATRREVGEVSVDLGKLYKNKRKIERSKMKDLQELCHKGTIPSAYHDFYLNNLVTGGNSHDSSDSEMENV